LRTGTAGGHRAATEHPGSPVLEEGIEANAMFLVQFRGQPQRSTSGKMVGNNVIDLN